MKDIKVIITRAMLAFIAFIMIIIVYAFVGTSEDKGKIRKDEDRIVEYIKEKVELNDNEELRKIEFKEYKENSSTGTWKFYVVLNDRVDVAITLWGTGGRIYIDRFTEGTMKVLDDESKKKSNNNDIEVVYAN
jgi:hypothetical protein